MSVREIGIVDAFVNTDDHTILLRLRSFDWELRCGLNVTLCCGNLKITGRQVGVGNVGSFATVALAPAEDWRVAAGKMEKMSLSGLEMTLETE